MPTNPAANSSELSTRTGRPPRRSIARPTRGDTSPPTRRPTETPPTTPPSGQPVSATIGPASTAGK